MTTHPDYVHTAAPLTRTEVRWVGEAGHAKWSTRRMLAVSALISICLWTPIIYFAAKALGA